MDEDYDTSCTEEKRMADNYEITRAIRIGGKEVVFGVDESNEYPYFCAIYSANELFYQYNECMVGEYAEIMKLFGQRIQAQAERVLAEQEKITVPLEPLTADDCYPNDYQKSINGEVVAIRVASLAPEYRTANCQLVLVTGGNGSHAKCRGNACFCINLYTGEHTRWERYDVQGVVKPEKLPAWAKERLAVIQQEQAEKQKKVSGKGAR